MITPEMRAQFEKDFGTAAATPASTGEVSQSEALKEVARLRAMRGGSSMPTPSAEVISNFARPQVAQKIDAPESQQTKVARLQQEAGVAKDEATKANSFMEKWVKPIANTVLPGVYGLGETMQGGIVSAVAGDKHAESVSGLYDANLKLLNKIHENERQGKNVDNLKQLYNQNVDEIESQNKTYQDLTAGADKTNLQVAGEIGMTGLNALTMGTYGKAAAGMETGKLATKVAPDVVKGVAATLKQPAKFFSKETAKIVGEGAALGEAFDVASNLEQGETGTDVLTKGYGKFIGAGIPALTRAGSSAATKIVEATPNNAKTKFAENLNKLFESAPKSVKKLTDYAEERGINIGQEIADRGFMPKVEGERMKFGNEPFVVLDKEITDKSKVIDEAVKQYPDTKITVEDTKNLVASQIEQSPVLYREGRVGDVTKEAQAIVDEFAKQTGRDYFTLPELQEFKKGMWGASKKFKLGAVGKSDAYSEIGTTFRKVIEQEIPDANIKQINSEIGKAQELYTVMDKMNGLQGGGIVLQGGKMGKYFGDITGAITGGVMGNMVAPGPLGIAIGGATGQRISAMLRGLSQKSSLLGPLDRILLKYADKAPESTAVIEAQKFLEQIKNGKTPTITPRVNKAFEDAIKSEYLLLPAPKTDVRVQMPSGPTIPVAPKGSPIEILGPQGVGDYIPPGSTPQGFKSPTVGQTALSQKSNTAVKNYIFFNHSQKMTPEVIKEIENLNIKPSEPITLYKDNKWNNKGISSWSKKPFTTNVETRIFKPEEVLLDTTDERFKGMFTGEDLDSLNHYNRIENEVIVKPVK